MYWKEISLNILPFKSKIMEILLWNKTNDKDLTIGLQVCYQDLQGSFTKLGVITDTYLYYGIIHYLINTSIGAYLADELKLIKS